MRQPQLVMVVCAGVAFVAVVAVWALSRKRGPQEPERSQAQDRLPCDVLDSYEWRDRLGSLTEMSLARCGLTSISPNIGRCVNLVKLDLAHNDLETLPDELELLPKLEVLFVLGSRRMKTMPPVLGRLKSVTRLGLRSNGIEKVVGSGIPPYVEHLILTDNRIEDVDESAYQKFGRVRKLMLANNNLESFTGGANPRENLRSLELVRLANNDLSRLSDQVLRLPKLAWIALAGNPKLLRPLPTPSLPRATWTELETDKGEALGSGASGVVRSAVWRKQKVAVKRLLDKSSDGRAEDEVASVETLFAGVDDAPDSLVRALGVVEPLSGAKNDDDGGGGNKQQTGGGRRQQQKQQNTALIMELLPSGVRDLAKPPTIVEVTRDRYPEAERFSPQFVYDVATNVCSALVHLHDKKVCHGDVYAHNTLVETTTNTVKLGDLGASFAYGGYFNPQDAYLFERVEVRAYGVLIAELASRIFNETNLKNNLMSLAQTCLQPDVDKRPTFSEIRTKLDDFKVEF